MNKNPFAVEHPESLNIDEVRKLFIKEATDIENLMSSDHTFVWGARGSGKSMVLRYLESIDYINGQEEKKDFISIYIPIKEGMFNKSEFLEIENKFSVILSEHLFNMNIALKTIEVVEKVVKIRNITEEKIEKYVQDIIELFGYISLLDTLKLIDEQRNEIKGLDRIKKIFYIEITKVVDYLNALTLEEDKHYRGAATGYLDFLLPFMSRTLKLIDYKNLKFYLLLDDAGRMHDFQQKIINSWIANRDQRILCLKVSAVKYDYKTFRTSNKWNIEKPHDYSEIETDDVYNNAVSQYNDKVRLICNRRLELAGIDTDIKEYLQPDDKQQKLLDNIRRECIENENVGINEDKLEDMISHKFFTEIGNGSRNYAGFDNLVCISSGVIRDFLQPCQVMYNKAIEQSKNSGIEMNSIPSNIQNDVITEFSKSYLDKIETIKMDIEVENHHSVDLLKTFILTLGKLFYERLKDTKRSEKRIVTFSIKDSENVLNEYNKMLELAVQYGYFKKSSYSSKQGGGRNPSYILSRKLAPAFKIDPSSIKGRVELLSSDIQLACENPSQFLGKKLNESLSVGEKSNKQLKFF